MKVRDWKIFKANKHEFYLSLAAILIGIFFGTTRPQSYRDVLVAAAAVLIGFACSLNAVLDKRRMNWLEFALALAWFAVLLFFAPLVLWHAFSIETFGDR